MPCYRPIVGYKSQVVNPSGKRSIVFNLKDGFHDLPVLLPCGQCIGCRLERSRSWATRCMHEASMYDRNCFLTLTYDPAHLPASGSLVLDDIQRFLKRLRKNFPNDKLRYFLCGEYGDDTQRPHYHIILFNFDFFDKTFHKSSYSGCPIYISRTLDRIWGNGICWIGSVTFESAAYVARYVLKKVTGDKANDHYQGRLPEFCTMSRKPGIGLPWLERYFGDVYPHDFVVVRNGIKCRPPRFYDNYCEEYYPELFAEVKRYRKSTSSDYMIDELRCFVDYERLEKKEIFKMKQIERLMRNYENL